MLIAILETKGADFGQCVCVDRHQIVPESTPHPQLVIMTIFRWEYMSQLNQPVLKKLPCCHNQDPLRICLNPYHWCVQLSPDSTSSNEFMYIKGSRLCDDTLVSQATGGTEEHYNQNGHPWCEIRYWEGRERKGNPYGVLQPVINILGETPCGSGLSLAAFFGGPAMDPKTAETRQKICQGLVLWQENDVVWVYNRSETAIYLNSATLDGSFYHLNLYKCPPGYAMIVYYYDMARHLMNLDKYDDPLDAQADVNSVRISFAKGWGGNYHRREILSCPCWMEINIFPSIPR